MQRKNTRRALKEVSTGHQPVPKSRHLWVGHFWATCQGTSTLKILLLHKWGTPEDSFFFFLCDLCGSLKVYHQVSVKFRCLGIPAANDYYHILICEVVELLGLCVFYFVCVTSSLVWNQISLAVDSTDLVMNLVCPYPHFHLKSSLSHQQDWQYKWLNFPVQSVDITWNSASLLL